MLCPRGHFIAHIGLYVYEYNDGEPEKDPIRMHPRGPRKEYVGNLSEGHHGFEMALHEPSKSYNVRLRCMNKRCSYSGSFNFFVLSSELAAAALNGHAEYRLTD